MNHTFADFGDGYVAGVTIPVDPNFEPTPAAEGPGANEHYGLPDDTPNPPRERKGGATLQGVSHSVGAIQDTHYARYSNGTVLVNKDGSRRWVEQGPEKDDVEAPALRVDGGAGSAGSPAVDPDGVARDASLDGFCQAHWRMAYRGDCGAGTKEEACAHPVVDDRCDDPVESGSGKAAVGNLTPRSLIVLCAGPAPDCTVVSQTSFLSARNLCGLDAGNCGPLAQPGIDGSCAPRPGGGGGGGPTPSDLVPVDLCDPRFCDPGWNVLEDPSSPTGAAIDIPKDVSLR
jgi:hypothetical protein